MRVSEPIGTHSHRKDDGIAKTRKSDAPRLALKKASCSPIEGVVRRKGLFSQDKDGNLDEIGRLKRLRGIPIATSRLVQGIVDESLYIDGQCFHEQAHGHTDFAASPNAL